MSAAANLQHNWVDIVPPQVPSQGFDPIIVTVVALALLASLVWLLVWYRHPRQRAKRELRRLGHELTTDDCHTKTVCFRIRQCLRSGLDVAQLQTVSWHDQSDDWQAYLNRLTQYCFAAGAPAVGEVRMVMQQALVWLNKRPCKPVQNRSDKIPGNSTADSPETTPGRVC